MKAAQNDNLAVVKYLLSAKAVRATIDMQDQYGRTALFVAAEYGHLEVVKLLAEAGANPMLADNGFRTTATGIAHLYGDDECVELLQVGTIVTHVANDSRRPWYFSSCMQLETNSSGPVADPSHNAAPGGGHADSRGQASMGKSVEGQEE